MLVFSQCFSLNEHHFIHVYLFMDETVGIKQKHYCKKENDGTR